MSKLRVLRKEINELQDNPNSWLRIREVFEELYSRLKEQEKDIENLKEKIWKSEMCDE